MKKFFALALSLTMAMALVGCGPKTNDNSDADPAPQEPNVEQIVEPSDGGEQKVIDLNSFMDDLAVLMEKNLGGPENSPEMVKLDGETISAQYPGLLELEPKQVIIAAPMISSVVAEFALVEAKTPDEAAAVADIFEQHIAYMVGDEENPGAAWYPETIEQWKQNARVINRDNYVMLVAIEDSQSYVDAFHALFA